MDIIPQHVYNAVDAIPDHEPLNTKQAAIYTGLSERTLERRRAAGDPPEPLARDKGQDCRYMKEELRKWRKPQGYRRPMHSYQLRDGAIRANADWDATDAVIGSIEELLEMEWTDTSLMRQALVTLQAEQKEALAAFRADQEEAMAGAFRRVTEVERKQLTKAVGDAGTKSGPGII